MIAAVNGGAYGGGTEMILNCDIVVAGEDATIALPEVKRGVFAAMGGQSYCDTFFNNPHSKISVVPPRIGRVAGHQVYQYDAEAVIINKPPS